MRYKVLLADDDPAIARVVDSWLKKAGYSVMHCYSGLETLQKIGRQQPDIVVMDVLLGDADGSKICQRLRQDPSTGHIPIILMSAARTGERDMVSGLQGGADDYLTKPLKPEMLLAKIEAVLRRSRAPEELGEVLKSRGLELNVAERSVRVKGKLVKLTRKEFDLLTVLLRRAGKVSSPNYLLETVWGYETEDYNDPRTVQVHISRLKKKLGKKFAARIENVIGSGYRIK